MGLSMHITRTIIHAVVHEYPYKYLCKSPFHITSNQEDIVGLARLEVKFGYFWANDLTMAIQEYRT